MNGPRPNGPRPRGRVVTIAALATAITLALAGTGCTAAPAASGQVAGTARSASVVDAAPPAPRPQYVALADAVLAHGGQVWVEADLVKAWLAGPQRYHEVLDVVIAFVQRPGIAGVKIADELGYGDGLDPAQALAFLKETTTALHARAPGRKVLADLIVPELGCLDWRPGASATTGSPGATASPTGQPSLSASGVFASQRTCGEIQRAKYPAATLAAVDVEIAEGGLDVVDLSAGLRADQQYLDWGTTRDAAMEAIWVEASRRWSRHVTLQARKALAHPGPSTDSAAAAERDVHTFVDIPLAHGASAVDIWTWSAPYKGGTYQLTDPGLADNALMRALRSREAKGVHLWTHMSPSFLQKGLEPDVAAAIQTFGTIFVASGTG